MVFHLVLSFLQLSFLDGPDPFLDETLYVFLRNISPPRARKSLCGYSHLSVVIFLQVLKRGTVSCTNLLVSSKCSRSLHSPFHRRQWRNVSFTSLSETCLTFVSCTVTISRRRFFWRAVHIDTPQQMGLFSVCSMQTWHVPSLRAEPLVEYDLRSALRGTISATCDWCHSRAKIGVGK